VSLKTALAEVKAKVFGDGGGGVVYDCGPYPIHNPTDTAAVLEHIFSLVLLPLTCYSRSLTNACTITCSLECAVLAL